jgi:CheY-like chemotaxis protein
MRTHPRGTVLLVADDPRAETLARLMLDGVGYLVLTAGDDDVAALARAARPDLVLLDLTTPHPACVALSLHLRADQATAHIPIVRFAAELAPCIRAGMLADAWLARPARAEQFYEVVARWTAGRAIPQALQATLPRHEQACREEDSYATGGGQRHPH